MFNSELKCAVCATYNTCRCQQSLAPFAVTLSLLPRCPPSSLSSYEFQCIAVPRCSADDKDRKSGDKQNSKNILARTVRMRCLHRGSSATTQQQQQRRQQQWRRHLLSGPMLIALATLDLSSASRWTTAPAPPQSARGSIQHVASTPSALAGRLAVRVRGGAIESEEDDGNDHEVRDQKVGGVELMFLVEKYSDHGRRACPLE